MPYTTGTATDHNDLLDDLRTWLTGLSSPWTSLAYSAGATPADASELYLEGPGAGAGMRTYIGIRTSYDATYPAWSWEVRAMTDYDAARDWETQPGVSPSVYLNLNASSQDYWFFANDRRFVVVSAVDAAIYCSLYAGMFLPYATPDEYPQPLFIGGMYSYPRPAAWDYSGNRFFVDPGYGAAYYFKRSPLEWVKVYNNNNDAGQSISWDGANSEKIIMWPHRSRRAASTSYSVSSYDWSRGGWDIMRPNADGEHVIWRPNIIDTDSGIAVGALDGCYSVPGFGLTTTQAITLGSRSFVVFQNLNRSTRRDFMAIEEVS